MSGPTTHPESPPADTPSQALPPAADTAPAKPAGGKLSTADILAAARGKAEAPSAPAAPAAASAPATPPKAEAPAAPTPVAPPAAAEPTSGGVVKVDRSSMSVQQMIDYCRDKDAK